MARSNTLWRLLEDSKADKPTGKEAILSNLSSDGQNDTQPTTIPPAGIPFAGPEQPDNAPLAPLLARFHGLHLQHELDNANQAMLKQELGELLPRLEKGEAYCNQLDPKDKSEKALKAKAKLRELRHQHGWLDLQIHDYQTSIDRAAVDLGELEEQARNAAGMPGAAICVHCFTLYTNWGEHQAQCCPWEE